jgi:hypothetical protein
MKTTDTSPLSSRRTTIKFCHVTLNDAYRSLRIIYLFYVLFNDVVSGLGYAAYYD